MSALLLPLFNDGAPKIDRAGKIKINYSGYCCVFIVYCKLKQSESRAWRNKDVNNHTHMNFFMYTYPQKNDVQFC